MKLLRDKGTLYTVLGLVGLDLNKSVHRFGVAHGDINGLKSAC